MYALLELSLYLLLGLLFFIWAIWIIQLFRQKQKRFFMVHSVLFIVVSVSLSWYFQLLPGAELHHNRQQNEQLTGEAFRTSRLFEYETKRTNKGHGYSFWVYEIDEKAAAQFEEPQAHFYKKFPLKPQYREHWQQKKWTKTPLPAQEQNYAVFALNELRSGNTTQNEKLKVHFQQIESMLQEEGHYYAFNYKQEADKLRNIDFFILSPKERKLIIINFNS